MGESTKIGWCDHTLNPWMGCTHVGPGCDNCYAEMLMDTRYGRVKWGAGQPRVMVQDKTWLQYRKWQTRAAAAGVTERVFCGSLMDWCDLERPEGGLARIHQAWRETPDLIWLMLTKRVPNIERSLPADWGEGYPNVMLMATICNQEEADRDLPTFLRIPARWHGVSCEPMLGPVDFTPYLPCPDCKGRGWYYPDLASAFNDKPGNGAVACERCKSLAKKAGYQNTHEKFFRSNARLDQIIVGGESGGKARPMHPDWARSMRDQCVAAGVAFFFKQWGAWLPGSYYTAKGCGEHPTLPDYMGRNDVVYSLPDSKVRKNPWNPRVLEGLYLNIGKEAAGRDLDGREWDEMPEGF